ncbi:hypothetical protein EYF80_064777 [Liparis tanakae]|uniref:Uncharacterized protein n=1 Tax=Liparis tanakae TaxID=230148 RepID=A0A4Z2E8K5_9TELE|nr:hypothetical protein EYF80_064777 [Liparis tanakae]
MYAKQPLHGRNQSSSPSVTSGGRWGRGLDPGSWGLGASWAPGGRGSPTEDLQGLRSPPRPGYLRSGEEQTRQGRYEPV